MPPEQTVPPNIDSHDPVENISAAGLYCSSDLIPGTREFTNALSKAPDNIRHRLLIQAFSLPFDIFAPMCASLSDVLFCLKACEGHPEHSDLAQNIKSRFLRKFEQVGILKLSGTELLKWFKLIPHKHKKQAFSDIFKTGLPTLIDMFEEQLKAKELSPDVSGLFYQMDNLSNLDVSNLIKSSSAHPINLAKALVFLGVQPIRITHIKNKLSRELWRQMLLELFENLSCFLELLPILPKTSQSVWFDWLFMNYKKELFLHFQNSAPQDKPFAAILRTKNAAALASLIGEKSEEHSLALLLLIYLGAPMNQLGEASQSLSFNDFIALHSNLKNSLSAPEYTYIFETLYKALSCYSYKELIQSLLARSPQELSLVEPLFIKLHELRPVDRQSTQLCSFFRSFSAVLAVLQMSYRLQELKTLIIEKLLDKDCSWLKKLKVSSEQLTLLKPFLSDSQTSVLKKAFPVAATIDTTDGNTPETLQRTDEAPEFDKYLEKAKRSRDKALMGAKNVNNLVDLWMSSESPSSQEKQCPASSFAPLEQVNVLPSLTHGISDTQGLDGYQQTLSGDGNLDFLNTDSFEELLFSLPNTEELFPPQKKQCIKASHHAQD